MKLYFKPGACSMASHIVLNELKESFELESVNTEQGVTDSGADYKQINPKGYVPTLRLEAGELITENIAILQYLGDKDPQNKLTPQYSSTGRIRLLELLSFASSELHKTFSPFFSSVEMDEKARASAESKIATRVDFINDRLEQNSPYLLGENFSVADAYFFVILNWSGFINFDLSPWPRVQ
ncbi:MAG: glutathione binding-like protein, partial [Kangiellaceae bacterium]|nr:glutathione binding-like protein [Kangiellaceae bacterium]